MNPKKTGLLGHPLSHSVSPLLHALLGDDSYRLFDTLPEDLERFLRSDEWDALNVTIPYKKEVLRFCDAISPRAQRCNSANILIKKDGKILADNSDYAGFCDLASGITFRDKKVCVLGSGGVSATVRAAAADLGAREIVTVSRTKGVRYSDTDCYCDSDILINTTPVGMFPNTDASPIDLSLFTRLSAVLDLVANPLQTQLVFHAKEMGILARGGFRMLTSQAHEARRVFCGQEPVLSREELYRFAKARVENIVLVGMPGCGKTTLGTFLAKQLDLPFFDSDEEVEKRTGQTVPRLFAEEGEAYFRALEEEAIEQLSQKSGIVLATGGGAPLSKNNRLHLKQNAFVIHLDCKTEELSCEGRPLSTSFEQLCAMKECRAPFYEAVRDAHFSFSKTDETAAEKLLTLILRHREEV